MKRFDEDQLQTITLALGHAAEMYEADALKMVEVDAPRLADQFRGQAKEARELALSIEAGEVG